MTHKLPTLEYEYNSLEPFIDEQTMRIHHTKHHQTYTDKFNEALAKHPEIADKNVEELLANDLKIVPEDIKVAIKNHGGGYLNHCFFWTILSPNKQSPSEDFQKILSENFGSLDKFKEQFSNSALTKFGSGWAWLVFNPKTKKLEILSTSNQDSPISDGKIPILGLDLWEHSYYLKYQNKRADYIQAFWNIINWNKVEEIYESIK